LRDYDDFENVIPFLKEKMKGMRQGRLRANSASPVTLTYSQ
jgi:hypothetical protein